MMYIALQRHAAAGPKRALGLMLNFAFLLGLCSCGLVQSAGDVEIGASTLPRVTVSVPWPKLDDILGPQLKSAESNLPIPGAPTSLESATLAHVQGLMTIDGQCHRSVDQPAVVAASGAMKNLHIDVVNCGDPNRCLSRCQGFRGMRLEASIDMQLLNTDNAAKIKKYLSRNSMDAIVQIRAQFFKLMFYRLSGKDKVNEDKLFSGFKLGLQDTTGQASTVLLDERYLTKISPTTPQRFELDPYAPFTASIKQSVLAGKEQWVQVFLQLDVAQKDLYSMHLSGTGVDIDFQPEFVINAIEVAKDQLQ